TTRSDLPPSGPAPTFHPRAPGAHGDQNRSDWPAENEPYYESDDRNPRYDPESYWTRSSRHCNRWRRPTGGEYQHPVCSSHPEATPRCPVIWTSCGRSHPPQNRGSVAPDKAHGHQWHSRSAVRNGTSRGAGQNLPDTSQHADLHHAPW